MNIDDMIAIDKVLSGDRQAFRPLVETYSRLVFAAVHRIVRDSEAAEDIAQEAFLQAYRSLRDFRRESSFSTWLVRIAVNKALDYCRQQKAVPYTQELQEHSIPDCEENPETSVLRQEMLWQMREKVQGLPAIYRKVIYEYYFNQLPYKEIAAREGISVKTVESRLYRAKALLKESVIGGEGENVSHPSRPGLGEIHP